METRCLESAPSRKFLLFFFCSSIYNPIVAVLICGYVGLPFLNEPKGSAIRINSARRLTAQLELEFPPLLMRLFVLRSFFFSFKVLKEGKGRFSHPEVKCG